MQQKGVLSRVLWKKRKTKEKKNEKKRILYSKLLSFKILFLFFLK